MGQGYDKEDVGSGSREMAEQLLHKKIADAEARFVVKDSGERKQFNSGMVRDTAEGKLRPDLVRDGPMFLRWVRLLTNGAVKYVARNWMKATGQAEYDRFLESADRHYTIWYTWMRYRINIEDDKNPTTEPLKEDHAAATIFNINGAEYVLGKIVNEELNAIDQG
jgi:hypothetical protein